MRNLFSMCVLADMGRQTFTLKPLGTINNNYHHIFQGITNSLNIKGMMILGTKYKYSHLFEPVPQTRHVV